MSFLRFLTGGESKKESSNSGSTSSTYSGNVYKDYIQDEFNPQINLGKSAGSLMGGLLGMPGYDVSNARDAFQGFKENAGYDFALGQGIDAIDGSQAAKGMLRSGATLKGLEKYRQGLSNQYMNQFLDSLLKQQTGGLQAGSIISDAGRYSTSDTQSWSRSKGKSGSHGGLLSALNSIGGMIAGAA